MTDKNLTNNETIKALEGAILNAKGCDSKVWSIEIYKLENALDLITRQQAEYENLKVENQSLRGAANSLKMHYEEAQAEIESLKIFRGYAEKRASDYKTMRDKYLNAKSEAVKEFAERLKEKSEIVHLFSVHTGDHYMVDIDDIDNLVKEMVGENNG